MKNLTRRAAVVAGTIGLMAPAAMAQKAPKPRKYARLHKAVEDMAAAKEWLKKSPDVFGGHKQKSIEAIDAAIAEVRAGLIYAKDL